MIDRDVADWILRTYAWLIRVPGVALDRNRPLVTPAHECFRGLRRDTPGLAQRLLGALQCATGTSHWPCRLSEQPSREVGITSEAVPIVPAAWEPAGTFRRSFTGGTPPELTYQPMLLQRPVALTALLAHGLSHLLLARCPETPPGGERTWDHVTDLGAVYLGAGVFIANAAHQVVYEEGVHWEGPAVYCQGWLAEPEISFALAVFARVHGHPVRSFAQHLRPSPRAYLHKAARLLRRDRRLATLWREAGLPGTTGCSRTLSSELRLGATRAWCSGFWNRTPPLAASKQPTASSSTEPGTRSRNG
ncbi:MAG: hypothetical protein MJE66_16625 [Proteobacteria bacterium]|nr:hypothetical protein [Pseudomonadota bacterium]